MIEPAQSEEENVVKLQQVLELASKHGLIINWNKCRILFNRVKFPSHIVENGSIRPSEEKTLAVLQFPKPTSTKAIKSFLGSTGHFKKFIPQYAITERPRSNILRDRVKYEFGPSQEQSFDKLKASFAQDPVLKIYRVGAELEDFTRRRIFYQL